MNRGCVAVFGGSFDPVHVGHVTLAEYFVNWLMPDELRIIPAGNPWQKGSLQANAEHRMEMARLAFHYLPTRITIDSREIQREGASYTIDTLRDLRQDLGPHTSLVFLLGADQLQKLHTWKAWQQLFDYAHLCAASRPGFTVHTSQLPPEIAREFVRRTASAEQMRNTPNGLTYLASNLAIDVSATDIRAALQSGQPLSSQVPPRVLDYIQQHHLYQTNGY